MEHKIIRGGGEYLPFARSCVAKIKKLGLSYASMTYSVGGATIKVRIAPGHEYIEIVGGGYFVSVFPDVQCPETSPVSGPLPGVAGAALRTGTFPATTPIDAGYPSLFGKTRFGSSPYNKKFLRMGQSSSTPVGVFPITVANRWGVIGGTSIHSTIYTDEGQVLSIDSPSPYGGVVHTGGAFDDTGAGYESTHRNWATSSVRFTPCINSSKTAVLACLTVSTEDSQYAIASGGELDYGGRAMQNNEGGQMSGGTSGIRIFRPQEAVDGEPPAGLQTVDFAPLGYAWKQYTTLRTGLAGGYFYSLAFEVANDVETSYFYRRWHATDKVSVAPDGSIFALRETSSVESRDAWESGVEVHTYTAATTRGYALSFLPPKGAPHNSVAAKDIGPLGYIDGVFPSADNKKVFVYYGTGSGAPPYGNSAMFAPTAFDEFLDVYSVTRDGDSYSVALTSTINLGPVTLRVTGGYVSYGVPELRTDHYESKLHGAALEVNGFIWADRYCFIVAENEFVAIPEFVEFPVPFENLPISSQAAKDLITGPENDRTSYLAVSPSGRSATYVMFKSGKIKQYTLKKDALTGVHSVGIRGSNNTVSGYSWGEDFSAKSVWFSHTPSAT